ncbi:MAG: ABC-type sulfate transport system permease component [Polaribacter sp.]|jgi:ABC-type sulfate transport system permease component|uniref:CCC motif membrane protein n=1 Tax=Polaribacter sp. TaxID=1920175 RepID=UPI003AEB907C
MKKLNTTLIYVLSSISLLCCCFAGLGILLALPSFLIANKKLKDAVLNPEEYDADEIKAMKTAKTFAMVALIINGLTFVYSAYDLATSDFDKIKEEFQNALDQYKQ